MPTKKTGNVSSKKTSSSKKSSSKSSSKKPNALDVANDKSKKTYDRSKGDLQAIHAEVKKFLTNTNAANAAGTQTAITNTEAANAALQSQLTGLTAANRQVATGEQDRLGIGQAGMGTFDADAAVGQRLAAQSGNDQVANLRLQGDSAAQIGNLYLGVNEGQQASALGQHLNRYNDERDANKEAYDKMVAEEKAAKLMARNQKPFTPYGGGGGRPFVPYGGGGGSNFVPYGSGGGPAAVAPAAKKTGSGKDEPFYPVPNLKFQLEQVFKNAKKPAKPRKLFPAQTKRFENIFGTKR